MRLGGPVLYQGHDPVAYAEAHVALGYRAAYAPDWVTLEDPAQAQAVARELAARDIVLAEVGAWCNPLSNDPATRQAAIGLMTDRLRLADLMGARTCVNVLGTKGHDNWYGPDAAGYSQAFFDEAVALTQHLVDTVQPANTTLSLEMMPYYFLDGPEEYLRFLAAVDRPQVAAHMDLCNSINSPRRYYGITQWIEHTFDLLGDRIITCHLKDLRLNPEPYSVRFDEVRIGLGEVDYAALIGAIERLDPDMPGMLEHLETAEDYAAAAAIVRSHMLAR
ncbi:MAG: TIM barrel protein [Bifidobacteriaceae bacterium]|jgi:sugar phosphate isomerase/epimerase|nr:TIM barrel protein [Bifidobacteriaceae bacterium]